MREAVERLLREEVPHACREQGTDLAQAVAVEDSIPGAHSAGITTIGDLQSVVEHLAQERSS